MVVPSPRNSLRPARGLLATLQSDIASLGEGEVVYATDENRFYVKEGGILTVASATAAQGVLADTATQPGDNNSTLTNDSGFITLGDVTSTANNLVYVNASEGDDGTGALDDPGKPFLTIKAALAAIPPAGNYHVLISPGTYVEVNPLNIPDNVLVTSVEDFASTVTVVPAVNTDHLFVLGAASQIRSMVLIGPTSLGKAALTFAGGDNTTGLCQGITVVGQSGSQGDGFSLESTGTGTFVVFLSRYGGSELKNIYACRGGNMVVNASQVPSLAGATVTNAFYIDKSVNTTYSEFDILASSIQASYVTEGIYVNGGEVTGLNLNISSCQNGIVINTNDYDVRIESGKLEPAGNTFVVTSGITGSSGKFFVFADLKRQFDVQNPAWWSSEHKIEFTTTNDNPETFFPTKQIWGASQVIGQSQKPGQIYVGYGAPHTNETSVFATSNNTSTTEGNGLVDLTTEASDKNAALTFSFNSNAVDEAIYFCTAARDTSNNLLKHYGYCLAVLTGDSRDGEYIYEIWNGSQWEKIYVQSTSAMDGYNYANDHFWRGSTIELQWTSIEENTTWSLKTINGVNAYWSRIRIVSSPTTAPVFYHLTAVPDGGFIVTFTGKQVFFGKGQFRRSTQVVGNSLSASGGVLTGTEQIGTGVNQWSHQLANSTLDGAGDRLHWQYQISEGTCSAMPIYFNVSFSFAAGTGAATLPTLGFTVHKIPVVGMLIADPNGGKVPVPRTNVDTGLMTDGNPTSFQTTLVNDDLDKIYNATFGPYYIEDCYEGDMLACYLELIDDGSANADITIWNLSVRSFRWTEGERQTV